MEYPMNPLALKAEAYLQSILKGMVGGAHPISPELRKQLPHYLIDRFDLWSVPIAGETILLAVTTGVWVSSVGDTKKMLARITEITGMRVLYVLEAVQSYQRKRLIEAGVEFLVPDSQFFAPGLGVVLRDQFATQRSQPTGQLSPSAQAILISLLLSNELMPVTASAVASDIGYTGMTATRAVRELHAYGLVRLHREGRTNQIALIEDRARTWRLARPLMRNPILRVEYPRHATMENCRHLLRLAGLDALSQLTMLAGSKHYVWAISQTDWPGVLKDLIPPDGAENAGESVQIWSYPPTLGGDGTTVDPLSLLLTLDGNNDERVQMAIAELEMKLWQ
jgi:DNA-binding MarR family transcriptional regulator